MLQSFYSSKRFFLKGLHQGLFQMLFSLKCQRHLLFLYQSARDKKRLHGSLPFSKRLFFATKSLKTTFFSQSVQMQ
jgi:hypothetical protein